jgi:hypothetical protein
VLAVLLQEVVIRHAGNVIAHHAMQGFLLALGDVEGRETARMFEVVTKETSHTPHDYFPVRPHLTVRIEVHIQKSLQFLVVASSPGS